MPPPNLVLISPKVRDSLRNCRAAADFPLAGFRRLDILCLSFSLVF